MSDGRYTYTIHETPTGVITDVALTDYESGTPLPYETRYTPEAAIQILREAEQHAEAEAIEARRAE